VYALSLLSFGAHVGVRWLMLQLWFLSLNVIYQAKLKASTRNVGNTQVRYSRQMMYASVGF